MEEAVAHHLEGNHGQARTRPEAVDRQHLEEGGEGDVLVTTTCL